jgi:alpha-L-fucosidase
MVGGGRGISFKDAQITITHFFIISLLSFVCLVFSGLSMEALNVPPPKHVLPVSSQKQFAWHELEQYAFVNFTTNNFTNKEWGFGDEDPEILAPTETDVVQWIRTFKETGFKCVILYLKAKGRCVAAF